MDWPLVGRDVELVELGVHIDAGTGLVLAGDAGVGKTRLAAELTATLEAGGRPARSAVGTQSARGIPFGAVAHLLPPLAPRSGRAQMMQEAVAAIADEGGTPPVILLDDAHLLDDESAALAHTLVANSHVQVIATVRAGEQAPDAVTALWKDGHCVRFDLRPLDREAVAALLEQVLDGPVEQRTHHRLWQSSWGNVQYLREMVLGTLGSGTLRRDGGLWRLTQPLGSTPRLVELVQARLGRLEGGARTAVEMLALAEPLGVDVLQRACGDVLADLERHRIVRTVRSGRRLDVRLDHPIHAEVLRDALPPSQRRPILQSLTDALSATGVNRTQDVMRLAVWSLDSGGELAPDVLVTAGQRAAALHDHQLAERLARAALDIEEGFDAWLLLGNALTGQRRGQEASTTLDRADGYATTDGRRAALALARADVVHTIDDRPRDAIAILRRAAEQLDPEQAGELRFRAALIVFMLGDTTGLDQLSDPLVMRAPDLGAAMIGRSLAQVMTGRLRDAEESLAASLDVIDPDDTNLSMPAALLGMNKAMLDLYSGRVPVATADAVALYERALEAGASDLAGLGAMMVGECLTFAGSVEEAARRFQESAWLLAEGDPFATLPISVSGVARTQAQAGNVDKAAESLAQLDPQAAREDVRARLHMDHAWVWLHALGGDIDSAVALAREGADRAVEASHLMWAAIVLHAPARLGHADTVAKPLATLAEDVEGDLVATMAEHARALTASDAAALQGVTASFDRMGATIYAAESAAHAAVVLHSAGRRGDARRWRNRSIMLATRCPGARTPALSEPSLTSREREIALLAARGMPTKDIAGRLQVSVRTVDNHLAAVYRKLGADGRGQLAELLHPDDPA